MMSEWQQLVHSVAAVASSTSDEMVPQELSKRAAAILEEIAPLFTPELGALKKDYSFWDGITLTIPLSFHELWFDELPMDSHVVYVLKRGALSEGAASLKYPGSVNFAFLQRVAKLLEHHCDTPPLYLWDKRGLRGVFLEDLGMIVYLSNR